VAAAGWVWTLLVLLEPVVLVGEWRVLVWALAGSAGGPRRVLTLTIVMNVVSGILGTLVLNYLLGFPR